MEMTSRLLLAAAAAAAALASFSATAEAKVLNNTEKYPPCFMDDDCGTYHHLADHACFQVYTVHGVTDAVSFPPI